MVDCSPQVTASATTLALSYRIERRRRGRARGRGNRKLSRPHSSIFAATRQQGALRSQPVRRVLTRGREGVVHVGDDLPPGLAAPPVPRLRAQPHVSRLYPSLRRYMLQHLLRPIRAPATAEQSRVAVPLHASSNNSPSFHPSGPQEAQPVRFLIGGGIQVAGALANAASQAVRVTRAEGSDLAPTPRDPPSLHALELAFRRIDVPHL